MTVLLRVPSSFSFFITVVRSVGSRSLITVVWSRSRCHGYGHDRRNDVEWCYDCLGQRSNSVDSAQRHVGSRAGPGCLMSYSDPASATCIERAKAEHALIEVR